MFKQRSSGWERGAGGVVEVQGGDEGSEGFFFFRGGWEGFGGVWWEEIVWPERSESGLEHEQVCVCVFLFSFPGRDGL